MSALHAPFHLPLLTTPEEWGKNPGNKTEEREEGVLVPVVSLKRQGGGAWLGGTHASDLLPFVQKHQRSLS